ncbi:DUF7266 family protein [Halostella litorea]|uniref:DUF7266 family protein n=1 Tax=Halostella litorea TaxID=2528831 RepID=UPI001092836A|nr:hypothetical protein [Halostella litorea]
MADRPPGTNGRRGRAADRGVTPVVGKALEVAVVVLYVSLLTASLYGNAVPEYRNAAGAELGDRALATAAHGVQRAVPSSPAVDSARVRIDLPDRIRGDRYRVRADGEALVLDHPDPAVGGRSRLALPASVDSVNGTWASDGETAVVVERVDGGFAVRLEGDA